ncbi:hypothetical protein [Tardiphaga sp.]|uniref:hypothetical protein n=1 Tax=Tardiphaga sp. TaxID=1926292 RepID=UPI00352B5B79
MIGVTTALSKLQEEREASSAALASFGQRRKALLLDDASDKEIAKLEAEMDSHHLRLERLELLEDDLLDRARKLRSVDRDKQLKVYLDKYFGAAAAYIVAHRAAARAVNGVTAIVDEARAAGFEHEFMAHVAPPPTMLDLSQIAVFESEIERISESAAGRERKIAPSAPPSRRQPAAKPATAGTPRRVFDGERAPAADRNPRALFADVAKPGEKLVTISRNGYEHPDGRSCKTGDVVALPKAIADAVVRNSAGDYPDGVSA